MRGPAVPNPHNEVWVFARAKDPRASYLSNFTRMTGKPLAVVLPEQTTPTEFQSVELAFHACKFFCLVGGSRPDLAAEFAVGGRLGGLEGAAQKSAGGKKAFRERGVTLDLEKWGAMVGEVLRMCVHARAAVDSTMRTYLRQLCEAGTHIRHYVRFQHYRGADGKLVGDPSHDDLGLLLTEIGAAEAAAVIVVE